jgi:hypothetical protein
MPENVVSEFVFLGQEEVATTKAVEEEDMTLKVLNDENIPMENTKDHERQPKNGAEAYESLVKSLTECDADYMKDEQLDEEAPMDENFGLENNILEQFTGLFQ